MHIEATPETVFDWVDEFFVGFAAAAFGIYTAFVFSDFAVDL